MDNEVKNETVKISEKKNKKSIIAPIAAGVLIILLVIAAVAANMYYQYLQYAEIGMQYIYVFLTNLSAQLIAQVTSFVIVFLFFLINNFIMRKILYKKNSDLAVVRKPIMLFIITIVIAFFASRVISSNVYQNFLTFTNNAKFNQSDPIFNLDLSYYIFERPFYIAVIDSIKGILMLNFVYTLFIYFLLQLRDGIGAVKQLFKDRGVLVHCLVNIMLYVVAVALSYRFARENILYGGFCGVTGAGFADVNIWRLYYRIAPLFLLIIVPLTVYFLKKAKYNRAIITILVFPIIWVLTYAVSMVCQSIVVDPDELAKEQQYLQYNIDMTRNAFDLNSIQEQDLNVSNDLTYKDIINNQDKIANTVVADMDEYLESVNKQQSMGNYYKFNDSDLVPYEIDGKNTMAAVSARELDSDKISQTTDTYVNKMFKYTHSTGVTVSDVRSGIEDFIVKDIPALSNVGFPKIEQPRIYYGEKMNNSVVVNTNYSEVDYMNAEQSAYSYEGFGGIQMTLFNRWILALGERDYHMLFSSQITSESRALINRNVVDRVKKIAPFFAYDSDPYIIITDNGELKWVLDVYTVSNQYPYSNSFGNVNYIRCPAKAVVDAYNGTVKFYVTNADDVFVKTYQKIYPTLFEQGDIPEEIANHLRYPQDIFKIKAEAYKKYHITDAATFYDKNDVWDFAKEKSKKGDTQNVPNYYNISNNGITLNALYTSHQSNNINAMLSVGSNKDNYGQMILSRIVKSDETVCSTMNAEKLLEDNSVAAEQLQALSQNGAAVTVGNMQVITVKNSFIYFSPVYVKNTNNSAAYPELQKVIVVYDDKVAMENTLLDGLQVIFGKKEVTSLNNGNEDEEELISLINDIIDMYDGVKQYNSVNDWENYGKAMNEFDENMAKLKERREELGIIEPFVGPPAVQNRER